jgi:hypothetical protein
MVLKVFWSLHTFVSKVGFEIPGRVVERRAKSIYPESNKASGSCDYYPAATSAEMIHGERAESHLSLSIILCLRSQHA